MKKETTFTLCHKIKHVKFCDIIPSVFYLPNNCIICHKNRFVRVVVFVYPPQVSTDIIHNLIVTNEETVQRMPLDAHAEILISNRDPDNPTFYF